MRLTCPSCASEYVVDAAAIGDRGRMVRCANCDAEWFQAPSTGAAAAAPPPPAPEPAPTPEPTHEQQFDTAPPVVSPSVPEPAPVVQEYTTPPATEMDEYRVEPALPSYQTAAAENVERIYYDVAPAASEPAFDEGVVEETLVRRRKEEKRDELAESLRELEEDQQPRTGGAFLAGFSTVAVMAVIAIAVYVKAPDLAKVAPAIEGPLSGYTTMVDKGRFALAAATQN